MFATHFQKVQDSTLFTTRVPHNVLQPDLRVTIPESVTVERVLCRCWIHLIIAEQFTNRAVHITLALSQSLTIQLSP